MASRDFVLQMKSVIFKVREKKKKLMDQRVFYSQIK